jgi:glycosyltransferase involved in cell wall biosynthesis
LNIIKSVLEKYKHRNVKLISRPNCGVAATRDEGMSLATGEYIIHLDSDDWAETSWLTDMYDKAMLDSADIVVCDYNLVSHNKVDLIRQPITNNNINNLYKLLIGEISNSNWNKLVKRDLYVSNHICFSSGINMAEDFLVTLKLFYYSEKTSYLKSAKYNYNVVNESSLTRKYSEKSLLDLIEVTRITEDFLKSHSLIERLSLPLSIFKLSVKACFLTHSQGRIELKKKGLSLYPETNSFVFKPGVSKTLKIYYVLNKIHLLFLHKAIDAMMILYFKYKR